MADIAGGDGGLKMRFLSGAVFDEGGCQEAYRRRGINIFKVIQTPL